jgi:hypothetical protein
VDEGQAQAQPRREPVDDGNKRYAKYFSSESVEGSHRRDIEYQVAKTKSSIPPHRET